MVESGGAKLGASRNKLQSLWQQLGVSHHRLGLLGDPWGVLHDPSGLFSGSTRPRGCTTTFLGIWVFCILQLMTRVKNGLSSAI